MTFIFLSYNKFNWKISKAVSFNKREEVNLLRRLVLLHNPVSFVSDEEDSLDYRSEDIFPEKVSWERDWGNCLAYLGNRFLDFAFRSVRQDCSRFLLEILVSYRFRWLDWLFGDRMLFPDSEGKCMRWSHSTGKSEVVCLTYSEGR
jgi:hypothetical protein